MVFPFANFSYTLFKWAALNKDARVFAYSNPVPGGSSLAIVPLADLLNHNAADWCNQRKSRQMFFYNKTTEGFDVRANQDYKKGDELFNCYNPHSNFDLMRIYGFAMDNNQYNLEFSFFFLMRINLWLGFRRYNEVTLKFRRTDTKESEWLESTVVLHDNHDEMVAAIDNMLTAPMWVQRYCPPNVLNKTKTKRGNMKALWDLCRPHFAEVITAQLDGYQTTLDEDDALLRGEGGKLTRYMRNSVRYRISVFFSYPPSVSAFPTHCHTHTQIVYRSENKRLLHKARQLVEDWDEETCKTDFCLKWRSTSAIRIAEADHPEKKRTQPNVQHDVSKPKRTKSTPKHDGSDVEDDGEDLPLG